MSRCGLEGRDPGIVEGRCEEKRLVKARVYNVFSHSLQAFQNGFEVLQEIRNLVGGTESEFAVGRDHGETLSKNVFWLNKKSPLHRAG